MSMKARFGHNEPLESIRTESEIAWLMEGVAAGFVGAFVVAVFFLAFDLMTSHAFATPNALAAAFFQGREVSMATPIEPSLVFGYTLMHGALFLTLGVFGTYEFTSGDRLHRAPLWRTLTLGVLMFIVLECVFFVFGELFAPGAIAELGAGRVAIGNLLAAAAMTGWIGIRAKQSPLVGS